MFVLLILIIYRFKKKRKKDPTYPIMSNSEATRTNESQPVTTICHLGLRAPPQSRGNGTAVASEVSQRPFSFIVFSAMNQKGTMESD